MDQEFERRRQAGEPPFNGFTLVPEGRLPADRLRQALGAVLTILEEAEAGRPLYQLLDRRGDAVPIAAPQVRALLDSPAALADAGLVALFPSDRRFYFRFQASDGLFDLTGPKHLLEAAADAVAAVGVSNVAVQIAKLFFAAPPGDAVP